MPPFPMRYATVFAVALASLLISETVTQAQSTITDRPFDVVAGSGLWGSLLPAYELGTNGSGSSAFHDNLDDVGYYGDLKVIRRFLGTRTSFEARGFYAYSESRSTDISSNLDIPNPVTGTSNVFIPSATSSVLSDVDHYGYDFGLRDTWRTRFGGLSGGCLFSYMAFDQTFDVKYGPGRLFSERLESDYTGGKGVLGWDGCLCGRPSMLDVAVGFYQLRTDYRFDGGALAGSMTRRIHKTPITVETIFSTYHDIRDLQVGLTFAATYIAQMPVIEHNVGAPVSIDTDSGVLIRMMVEILL